MGIYTNYITESAKTNISILNESNITSINEVLIYQDYSNTICIRVDGDSGSDRNFAKDPYIKIYNNAEYNKATAVARVSLINPHYIDHKESRTGCTKFILTNKILKIIDVYAHNNWEYILRKVLEVCVNASEKDKEFVLSIPCPNFLEYKN